MPFDRVWDIFFNLNYNRKDNGMTQQSELDQDLTKFCVAKRVNSLSGEQKEELRKATKKLSEKLV